MVQLYDDLKGHETFEKGNKVSENIGSQICKCSSVKLQQEEALFLRKD